MDNQENFFARANVHTCNGGDNVQVPEIGQNAPGLESLECATLLPELACSIAQKYRMNPSACALSVLLCPSLFLCYATSQFMTNQQAYIGTLVGCLN